MVDALEVSPQRVLVELGDFALSVTGRRRWAPMETGVSVRVAAARLARGAKRGAQYYVIRGKETVDTTEKVRPGDTVLSLKQKIRDVRIQGYSTNIPLERQRLIIRGRQLVDGKRLYESNVFDGATVHLVLLRA